MKKYIISLLLGLTLLASCDYLDFNPEGSVPQESFWTTKEQAFQAVTSMYGYIRGWNITGGFSYLTLSEQASDNMIKGGTIGDANQLNVFDNFTYVKSDGNIYDYWRNRYTAINLSNQILENIPNMPDSEVSPELKERYLAEAKFLRAFHYFYITRAFGGVVIQTASVSNPESIGAKFRSSIEDTYAFIEQDLLEAIESNALPTTLPSAELGRTTVWAAKGLLAKVYLYQKKWSECHQLTQDIITNGGFSLYPNFYDLFRHEQEFCSESLFEVLASAIVGNTDLSNGQYSQIQGVREQFDAWGLIVPSDNLAAAFDAENDLVRKKYTILYRGDITPQGDTIKGITQMDGIIGIDTAPIAPRYSCKAFVSGIYSTAAGYGKDYNVRILRFAEILLMDAESAHYTGADVATPLNLVRGRVGLLPKANPTLEDIYLERRLELACEQDRFWDLTRTGRAATVLNRYGFKEGKHELFPIPETEVQKSGGTLTQNPGW